MTLNLEREQIENHYKSNAVDGIKEVAYDGHKFNLVDDTGAANLPAIRLTINSGEAKQVSLGAPTANIKRNAGIVTFEIYTEGGNGSDEANDIADEIINIYQNQNLGVVKCKVPYPVKPKAEEPYYKLNVVVPFQRDAFNA